MRLAKLAKLKNTQEQQLAKTLERLEALNEDLDSKGGKFTVATRVSLLLLKPHFKHIFTIFCEIAEREV